MMNSFGLGPRGALASFLIVCSACFAGDDPFADVIISYVPGSSPSPGYTNATTALGAPERFTGEGIFPSVVSVFSPPYGTNEILSISAGGQLTVRFNTPVTNDPNNLYGIDLLIFGTASFIDVNYPNGVVGGIFGDDGGRIEISADGMAWHLINGQIADGPMPTAGYVDSGPFDRNPGMVLTDFTRPVDPALSWTALLGFSNAQVMQKYRGSGGGVGVDMAATGLDQVSFVRISNPIGARENIEIDAFSDAAPRLPGDVDLNGLVNVDDLLLLISAWGPAVPGGVPADFDYNGAINVDDLLNLIAHWTVNG